MSSEYRNLALVSGRDGTVLEQPLVSNGFAGM
jgi:hypothetical protein